MWAENCGQANLGVVESSLSELAEHFRCKDCDEGRRYGTCGPSLSRRIWKGGMILLHSIGHYSSFDLFWLRLGLWSGLGGTFIPPAKVDAAVIKLSPLGAPRVPGISSHVLESVCQFIFAKRRKMIRHDFRSARNQYIHPSNHPLNTPIHPWPIITLTHTHNHSIDIQTQQSNKSNNVLGWNSVHWEILGNRFWRQAVSTKRRERSSWRGAIGRVCAMRWSPMTPSRIWIRFEESRTVSVLVVEFGKFRLRIQTLKSLSLPFFQQLYFIDW